MENKVCKHPFYTIQIQNTGEVYCCCCYWTDFYSFGNIFEQSFDEIWNGEKAKKFRQQFFDGDFKYCKKDVCDPAFETGFEPKLVADYPKRIEFSYDRHCNIRCIFCRNKEDKEEFEYNRAKEKRIEENFDRIFTPILKHVDFVDLNSAGELFASKHSIDILKKIMIINPNIRFNIISNGTLFSKETVQRLNLEDKMCAIIISMHSITKKTYDKLIERGDFDSVIKNVKYLAELKKAGKISDLQLNFVVTSLNYKEMVRFALFAKSLNAKAFFINYHRQIDSDELEKELDISNPQHKDYNKFVKLLQNPVFKEDFCIVNDYLKNLKPVKKSFWARIKNIIHK